MTDSPQKCENCGKVHWKFYGCFTNCRAPRLDTDTARVPPSRYEVHGCRELTSEQNGRRDVEVCGDEHAMWWTVYERTGPEVRALCDCYNMTDALKIRDALNGTL
jgi:hypothetical protein